jgi:predicted phosphodiesterase
MTQTIIAIAVCTFGPAACSAAPAAVSASVAVSSASYESALGARKPLRFVVYGDTRDGHDVHRKLVGMIAKEHADFVVNTGDLVKRGNQADLWKIFDDITGDLRKSTTYYAVYGNHDWGDEIFMKRFPAQTALAGANRWFSFDRADCHFVALCVDEHTDYGVGTPQYKWLQDDLESHRKKAKHLFVFFHVPPYSIGNHGMNPDIQETLCPIFDRYHVDMVMNGHDHNYYRTVRNGVQYVVTGGGAAPLYDCVPTKGAIPGDKWEKVNHYVVVEVSGARIAVRAIRVDWTLLDSFEVGVPATATTAGRAGR